MQNHSHSRRSLRHTTILDLVETCAVRSQADLKHLLETRGHDVNQATLSRDLRELGLAKGPSGYQLPPGVAGDELSQHLSLYLHEAIAAQNQVVLKTSIGGAQPLALALDRAALPECVGTLAGDDTILVICADTPTAKSLALKLNGRRA